MRKFLLTVPVVFLSLMNQCLAQIGSATTAFSAAGGPRTYLWYDNDLNSITFTFKSNDTVYYSFSTNGGISWATNVGPVYYSPGCTPWVPQGVIYNPSGNTIPANSFFTTFGGLSGCLPYTGAFEGTTPFGGVTNAQASYSYQNLIQSPSEGHVVIGTGETWWASLIYDAFGNYVDSVLLFRGQFDSVASNMVYSLSVIHVPLCDVGSGPMFYDMSLTWNDDGQVGYLSILGNDWVCGTNPTDSTHGLIVYSTTDGGTSWFRTASPGLHDLDPVLANNGSLYTSAFQLDCAVDVNNDLHAVFAVGQYTAPHTFSPVHGTWGLFDILISATGGCYGSLLAKPQTFHGIFGDGSIANPIMSEDNRAQISRSWDGSKIFFTWFDTDTISFGTNENINPDMHSIGYDVINFRWSADTNFTASTAASGQILWGSASYYTTKSGLSECIPVVYGKMQNFPISTGSQLDYYFIGNNCINTFGSLITPVALNCNPSSISETRAEQTFRVYPNPSSGKVFIELVLKSDAPVRVELMNAAGQSVLIQEFDNPVAGKNTFTINTKSLQKGIYFCRVFSGDMTKTGKVLIE